MRRCVLLALLATPAVCQDLVTETDIVLPAWIDYDDQFGYAVDVDADTLAITARNDHDGGAHGTVSIYVRSGGAWVLEQKLGGPAFSGFGVRVALDGERLAVGRPASSSGAVDLFVRAAGVWTLEDTVARSADGFGWDFDLDGDRLIVGAAREDGVATDAGAAYVYLRSGGAWQLEQELVAPFVSQDDLYGTGVALDGDVAVVGAPDKTWLATSRPGGAYVFRRGAGGWALETRLRNPSGAERSSFGQTVDVEGDLVVVGEPGAGVGVGSGAVLAFRASGGVWSLEEEFAPPDPRYNMQFGAGLALHAGVLLVGARYDPTAFLYEQGLLGWSLSRQLVPAKSWWAQNENSVALGDDWIVVGNRYEPTGALQGGAARVFARPLVPLATSLCAGDVGLCPCANESGAGALTGCTHSAGWGAQIAASGSASLTANDFTLHGRAWPVHSPALLYAAPLPTNPLPAGDGLLCLGGQLVRLDVDLGDELTWGPGLLGQAGALPGETWAFQVVLRDPSGPCGAGFNWTQALSVTATP